MNGLPKFRKLKKSTNMSTSVIFALPSSCQTDLSFMNLNLKIKKKKHATTNPLRTMRTQKDTNFTSRARNQASQIKSEGKRTADLN